MSKQEELKKAFDNTTLTSKMVQLNTEQATEFINSIVNESKMLGLIRTVPMELSHKELSRLFANGRFLQPGKTGVRLGDSKFQQFTGQLISLNTQLVRGAFFVTDEELQDNIEGGKVKDKFVSMITAKTGNELEEIMIYSVDSQLGGDAPSTLYQFKGIKQRLLESGHVVDATVGFADRKIAKNKFTKALKSIPTKFRNNLSFFMPNDAVIDYKLLFDTIADMQVRGELTSQVFGKPIVEVPLMSVEQPVKVSGYTPTTVTGTVAVGATVIPVASATGLTAGVEFTTNYGTGKAQTFTVVSVASLDVTVLEPVAIALANTNTVHKVTTDGVDVILSNPKNFLLGIQTTEMSFETERIASLGWVYHWKMRIDMNVEMPEASAIIVNLSAAE